MSEAANADGVDLKELRRELQSVYSDYEREVRAVVGKLVAKASAGIVDRFWRGVLARPRARFYLDHAVVSARLHQALRLWLELLFPAAEPDLEAVLRLQSQAGSAHARIRVPAPLLMFGMRVLRQQLYEELTLLRLPPPALAQAHAYVAAALDVAFGMMTSSHLAQTDRNTRSDEALRLYSLGHDLPAERERQRANLAEWAQELFFAAQQGGEAFATMRLSQSEFGLWLAHRGSLLFSPFPEFKALMDALGQVDAMLARAPPKPANRPESLRALKVLIERLAQMLSALFDRVAAINAARDPSTHLMSRRFLRPALSREIALQEKTPHPFCLVMFEIAHFAALRDRLGDSRAEAVIQQSASLIFNMARSSDTVFSLGRESFLLIRVESTEAEARDFAIMTAQAYGATHFSIDGLALQNNLLITAVVPYDGHPDPRYLIERAENALRNARLKYQ